MKPGICFRCNKTINNTTLISISYMHQTNDLYMTALTSHYYHEECYEEIAGQEYLEKLIPPPRSEPMKKDFDSYPSYSKAIKLIEESQNALDENSSSFYKAVKRLHDAKQLYPQKDSKK
jgi:hypothetical protein